MKLWAAQLAYFLKDKSARQNVRALLRLLILLIGLIIAFSLLFRG